MSIRCSNDQKIFTAPLMFSLLSVRHRLRIVLCAPWVDHHRHCQCHPHHHRHLHCHCRKHSGEGQRVTEAIWWDSVLLDLEDDNGTINNDDDGWKWMTSVFPPVRGMGWALYNRRICKGFYALDFLFLLLLTGGQTHYLQRLFGALIVNIKYFGTVFVLVSFDFY